MPIDDESRPTDARLSRRLLVLQGLAGAAGAAMTLPLAGSARAQGATDNDPDDPPGQGRGGGGATDNDPGDPPGRGRGGGGGGGRGVTDNDPDDPPGGGRRGGGGGVTDQDPSDPPGRGRGNRRRAIDSDPTD